MKSKDEMMIDEWTPIPGYEGRYLISKSGKIKTLQQGQNRLLSFGNRNGYSGVVLSKNGIKKSISIHRLVLLTFVGPSDLHVNHKNGIKSDNRLENLEYCTQAQNMKHASSSNLLKGKFRKYVFTPEQRNEIHSSNEPILTLSKRYRVTQDTIRKIKRKAENTYPKNSCGYRGVYRKNSGFAFQLLLKNKKKILGFGFKTPKEASVAYEKARAKYK